MWITLCSGLEVLFGDGKKLRWDPYHRQTYLCPLSRAQESDLIGHVLHHQSLNLSAFWWQIWIAETQSFVVFWRMYVRIKHYVLLLKVISNVTGVMPCFRPAFSVLLAQHFRVIQLCLCPNHPQGTLKSLTSGHWLSGLGLMQQRM